MFLLLLGQTKVLGNIKKHKKITFYLSLINMFDHFAPWLSLDKAQTKKNKQSHFTSDLSQQIT